MKAPRLILALSGLWLGFYLLGWADSDAWWGTHFLAFNSPGFSGILFLGAVALVFVGAMGKWPTQKVQIPMPNWAWALLAAMVLGVACYQFPAPADFYGDSPKYHKSMAKALDPEHPIYNAHPEALVFSPQIFHPKNGERTVLNAFLWLTSDGDYRTAVRQWNAAWGALFAFVWIFFLFSLVRAPAWRITLGLAGLTAPWVIFFGEHLEVYASSMTVTTAFAGTLAMAFRSSNRLWGYLLFPLWLLAIKMHVAAFLLAPVLGLAAAMKFWPDPKENRYRARWTLIWVMVPLFLAGAAIYFFVFGDHNDERFLGDGVTATERLFLPLFAPEAPLDRYSLFHPNHFFDFFNQAFLWSAPALLILAGGALTHWKKLPWNRPELVLVGLSLLIYTLFFFVLNPLLSMPVDWDLLSLPAPFLLLYAALLVDAWPEGKSRQVLLGGAAGTALLGLAFFGVHFDARKLGFRLEQTGKHVFKTYWIRSGGDITTGWQLMNNEAEIYAKRAPDLVKELEPWATMGKDEEYAYLLHFLGKYHRTRSRNLSEALYFHRLATQYDPPNGNYWIGLMETQFLQQDFSSAYQSSLQLVHLGHPNAPQAHMMALNCALEAELFPEALQQVEAYLKLKPNDQSVQGLRIQLQSGENLAKTKNFFRN